MPLFFVPMLGLFGIAIAMSRRSAHASPDNPPEDIGTQLLRWAMGLLSPQRAEWGQAMLGELQHIDGRVRRLRFALGCVGAALLLPPWGRAAAAVWSMSALALASVGLYAEVVIHYGLGDGEWIAGGILTVVLVGCLLGAAALVRRPGVATAGLLGGLFVALTSLTLSGFSFLNQILPDVVPWHPWLITLAVPLVVGAASTLRSGDPIIGKRVARLAAITGGLSLYLYRTIAVAAIGTGGPIAAEGGGTVRGTISDRLGNNLILMFFIVMVTATVGWAGAAATGVLARAHMRPATDLSPAPFTVGRQASGTSRASTTAPQLVEQAVPRRSWRPSMRRLLLCAVMAATLVLAVAGWLRS